MDTREGDVFLFSFCVHKKGGHRPLEQETSRVIFKIRGTFYFMVNYPFNIENPFTFFIPALHITCILRDDCVKKYIILSAISQINPQRKEQKDMM